LNDQVGTEARDDAITSGSDSRPGRDLRAPQVVDLMAEAQALFDEPEWADRDRNSRTVTTSERMRVTITALRAGAELGDDETNDTLAVHALRGRARLELAGESADLAEGQLVTVAPPGPWRLRADEDSLFLLTVALGSR
jgi:quercetin dioxygenase-like cupin family protein